MIPWKVVWIAVGGLVTLTAGLLPLAVGFNPVATVGDGREMPLRHVVMVAVTAVLVAIAVVIARNGVKFSELFMNTSGRDRDRITTWITLAILAHGAWVIALQITPQWWPWWPLVAAAMSGLEYGAAVLWEWREAHRPRQHRTIAENGADRALDDTEATFVAGLERSGFGSLALLESEALRERAD